MLAEFSRCWPRFSRQQSHRTTLPGKLSPAGFQPVSSQSGQGMSVQVTAKAVGMPRRAAGARLNLVERLIKIPVVHVVYVGERRQPVEHGRGDGGDTIQGRRR